MQAQEAVAEGSVGETGADPIPMGESTMDQKCHHSQAFPGVILRYTGENAVFSEERRGRIEKQKRFQWHAILSEKPVALKAPGSVANYLENEPF